MLNKQIKNIIFITLFILLLIYLSCNYNGNSSSDGGSGNGGGNEKQDKPIETIIFEKINSYIVFSTNNPIYLDDEEGSTMWIWGDKCENPMDEFEAEISKESGVSGYGYGLIFCAQDDTDPSDEIDDEGYNFLAVFINNTREYCITRCTDVDKDGVLEEKYIKEWAESPDLSGGYGVKNTVNIVYLGNVAGAEKFELTFNTPTETIEFEYDQTITFEMCGRYGYIVTLAPNENFPNVPVTTKYMQLIPDDISLPVLNILNNKINNNSTYNTDKINSSIKNENKNIRMSKKSLCR